MYLKKYINIVSFFSGVKLDFLSPERHLVSGQVLWTTCSTECFACWMVPSWIAGSHQGCLCSFKSLKERRTHSQSLFSGLSVLTTVRSCSFTLTHSPRPQALDVSLAFHFIDFFFQTVFWALLLPPHICVSTMSPATLTTALNCTTCGLLSLN